LEVRSAYCYSRLRLLGTYSRLNQYLQFGCDLPTQSIKIYKEASAPLLDCARYWAAEAKEDEISKRYSWAYYRKDLSGLASYKII
jgi:hypothetical protein